MEEVKTEQKQQEAEGLWVRARSGRNMALWWHNESPAQVQLGSWAKKEEVIEGKQVLFCSAKEQGNTDGNYSETGKTEDIGIF